MVGRTGPRVCSRGGLRARPVRFSTARERCPPAQATPTERAEVMLAEARSAFGHSRVQLATVNSRREQSDALVGTWRGLLDPPVHGAAPRSPPGALLSDADVASLDTLVRARRPTLRAACCHALA